MIVLSLPWFWFGFALGAFAGTLATNSTQEDFDKAIQEHKLKFWLWPRKPSWLVIAIISWFLLLAFVIGAKFLPWPWWVDLASGYWWKGLLTGSIIGAAAAPWLWLHFVRNFGNAREWDRSEKEREIRQRAERIWAEQGQREGYDKEDWSRAESEVEDLERSITEASARSADQQLARYQLLSVLLGVALFVTALWSVLPTLLRRTQQLQAFGVSLVLTAAQQANRGTELVGPRSLPEADEKRDRVPRAITAAYQIGGSVRALEQIGQDLKNFDDISMIDRDRRTLPG